jgi:hypothetical protein
MTHTQPEALKLALEALKSAAAELYRASSYCNTYEVIGNTNDAITAIQKYLEAQPAVQEPSPGGVLFAVEEAINNGDCPFAIEIAFDAYEAERKALAGITAAPEKGQP